MDCLSNTFQEFYFVKNMATRGRGHFSMYGFFFIDINYFQHIFVMELWMMFLEKWVCSLLKLTLTSNCLCDRKILFGPHLFTILLCLGVIQLCMVMRLRKNVCSQNKSRSIWPWPLTSYNRQTLSSPYFVNVRSWIFTCWCVWRIIIIGQRHAKRDLRTYAKSVDPDQPPRLRRRVWSGSALFDTRHTNGVHIAVLNNV